ncbi:MAG: type I pullulanase [Butyrivibrio sp.]|nr:type I pullulanase [Butyrivibrio sp.]
MKKFKRFFSLIIAFTLTASLIAGCGAKNNSEDATTETELITETEQATEKETEKGPSADVPSEITVNLHYIREDGDYTGWNVWFWTTGDGASYQFGSEADEHGVVCTAEFPAATKEIGFIVRLNEWESKDCEADRFIDTSSILAGTVDVYVVSGQDEVEDIVFGDDCVKGVGVTSAVMSDDYKSITVVLSEKWSDETEIEIVDGDGNAVKHESLKVDEKDETKAVLDFAEELDALAVYKARLNGTYLFDITIPDLFSSEGFENKFTYDGNDLGASWSKASTTFKVWAPTAEAVKVNLYKGGDKSVDDLTESHDMTAGEKGVWSVKVDGDLNGVYYTYTADFGKSSNEACDPYAKAVGVNGDRAMVIDMDSTNPDGWDKDKNPNADLNFTDVSVYELHIRDLSSDAASGIANTGKYLGLTEKGTVNSSGEATGLDHIKDLGITHIQLNPVYDYATVDEKKTDGSQYNWGYDPKNYNVPEGSYSTDPYNGEVRVKEFKQMVKTLHDNDISVIMDVVYNHTYNTDYCYNKLVPDYFFRPDSNGSGCGNDVASERAMVSKFIVDSVVYWAEEYHIDGFRFDLVGLIDIDTIKAVREELDKIDPSIIIYGEGWSLTTKTTKKNVGLAIQSNAKLLEGFGMFNDTIRDAIKGSVFSPEEKGFVNGDVSKADVIKNCIRGRLTWSSLPYQQIIYSCCHDNLTIWDEINTSNADDSDEAKIKQNLLSAAIVYTSQGVPFILAGEEFLRSKTNADGSFNSNSYNAPDSVNSLKWDDLGKAEYKTVYNYYKGMIAFRKAHAAFRSMVDAGDFYTFADGTEKGVIAYELEPNNGEVSDGIFVVYNALTEAQTVTLPEGEWTICVRGDEAGTESLGTASGSITVDGISATILVKGSLK